MELFVEKYIFEQSFQIKNIVLTFLSSIDLFIFHLYLFAGNMIFSLFKRQKNFMHPVCKDCYKNKLCK